MESIAEGFKRCTKCGEVKPRDSFTKDSRYRSGLKSQCDDCRRAGQREGKRAAYAADPEKFKQRVHTRKADDRENYLTVLRAYQLKNKDRIDETKAAERKRHRRDYIAKEAIRRARLRVEAPEMLKGGSSRRRAREKGADGCFTGRQFRQMCVFYGLKCLACGRTGLKLSPDHVVPLARGGSNDISNIQPLCWPCNNRKRVRIIDYRPDKGSAFAPKQTALFV